MAYMSQENKKQLAPAIRAVLKKYNMKGTISVDNYSTLVVKLSKGKIDFEESYQDINTYWIESHFDGVKRDFLLELKNAMMQGNYNNNDIMTDYFDVGWYITIKIGNYDKNYEILK